MEFIFFIGGIAIGVIIAKICETRIKTCGIIEVDHHTEQCKILLTSDDLNTRKTKKALFRINHDATISREEHLL